ncbi:hypothetical protein V2I01_21720 [Micromonospora sp. BRA006-A]|nr:hypothetical protein [Micromonospora sp. BRA006-A]
MALFREAPTGSTVKLDDELREAPPELLWLGYMGVVLYWVHDRSAGQIKTRQLIDGVVPLVDRLVGCPGCACCGPSPVRRSPLSTRCVTDLAAAPASDCAGESP